MTDQELAEFRWQVEQVELGMHREIMDNWLARLLRPVLDEIDELRKDNEKLRDANWCLEYRNEQLAAYAGGAEE